MAVSEYVLDVVLWQGNGNDSVEESGFRKNFVLMVNL